jgi:hypothetical protein
MRLLSLAMALAAAIPTATTLSAQTAAEPRRMSFAIESDVLSYGLKGYSGIATVSFANGLQLALGAGRYDVPTFLLEGDPNYDTARWQATATSIQVLRAVYRFNGPMENGFALGAIVLNQNWRLSGENLTGETKFQPLSVGLTAGYYIHIGKHLYLYPTTAFTYNTVASGSASLQGQAYRVARWAPNGSLHMGWEWTR